MLRDWGSVGRVVRVDDQVVGHLLFAPAVHLPGSAGFATAPVSPDAILLATGYVDPDCRGQGLGRVLVQAMAKDLIKRGGIGAVEAFGSLKPREGECVLPVDFLLAVGFRTHRPHAAYPRMRMDLATTVSWREEFEAALDRLVGVVAGKRRAPRPTSPTVPRASGPHPRGMLQRISRLRGSRNAAH
jgi:GNAT superfamily N-acetyltransferase